MTSTTQAVAQPHTGTGTAEGAGTGTGTRGGLIVAVLALGGIVVALMQTLLVPLIPQLPILLHASASNTSWAITATLLASAVATPVFGGLGDMYGKRRILVLSLALLVIGSAVCALSNSLAPMVVGRALQGAASGVIPLGISIMRDELPPKKLGSSMALMSSSLGVGGALGLPGAAVLAQHTNWHVLFWVSAGLGAVVAVLALAIVPESPLRAGGRFDALGAIGLSAGLVCLLLAVSKGASWGWTSRTTLGLFAAAVLILLPWGWWELRTPHPLVDLRTTARRQVLLTNIASIMVGFGMFVMMLVLPQLLEMPKATGYGLGQSLLVAGLCLAPGGLMMMIMAPVAARLSAAAGPKVSLMLGAIVIAAGYGLGLAFMGAVWQTIVFSCVITAGIGIAYAAMPALIMSSVPASETGSANGLNALMRYLGTSISSAVIAVVLSSMVINVGPYQLPSRNGFRVALMIGGGAALVAFLIAVLIPGRRAATAVTSASAPPSGATAQLVPSSATPAGRHAGTNHRANGTSPDHTVHRAAAPHAAEVLVMDGGGGNVATPITGHVRRSGGGAVGRAALTLIDPSGRQVGRAVSGEDGGYQLAVPGTGVYVLIASASAHKPQASTVTVGSWPTVADVVLVGSSSLSGTVSAAGTGTAIPGATAVLADGRGEVVGSTQTGADGRYAFGDLLAGQHTLAVSADAYQPVALAVSVPDSGECTQDVELTGGGRLRGTATVPDGRVVPDARIALLDQAGSVVALTTTNEAGEYSLSGLPDGDYTLVASGYPPVTSILAITGGRHGDHDVRLGHPDSIQVPAQAGNPTTSQARPGQS
jgi:EmrB/QacA subfamily drug resistance transporter